MDYLLYKVVLAMLLVVVEKTDIFENDYGDIFYPNLKRFIFFISNKGELEYNEFLVTLGRV